MNFGDSWSHWLGECTKETTEDILDYFYEQGGNFIDTANNYQCGESETRIGNWMKSRGNREQMVIATKYTTAFIPVEGGAKIKVNFNGCGAKSLNASITASLQRLQTYYIDLLYVHWWDYNTSIPEMMQALNSVVLGGRVLYLGISDAPAWVASKANEYARNHGMRQFSVYQGKWSAAHRDLERDIIPMCRAEGMALAPWGSLGGGKFKSAEPFRMLRVRDEKPTQEHTDQEKLVLATLEAVARRKSAAVTGVAIAYVMHKAPYVFPVLGGRKVEHIKNNIDALNIALNAEDIREIEAAAPFDLGFPHNFLWGKRVPAAQGDVNFAVLGGSYDHVEDVKPITPAKAAE
ncbi:norsolorinic acid reductase [Cordyceps militaris CM01]|uniref:Norsolorinic acid reductase n=1 Tax=Cordyceps militaris (strain CM01) TaxID=983644 RepID=G3JM42_CORMM|nr:norsolorinic acid reductase [Cordyceps militaris CM01]EGX90766.1 norsolorinic acid reductase [Cordyceps militaris CM01]